jgi:hypothetical protein
MWGPLYSAAVPVLHVSIAVAVITIWGPLHLGSAATPALHVGKAPCTAGSTGSQFVQECHDKGTLACHRHATKPGMLGYRYPHPTPTPAQPRTLISRLCNVGPRAVEGRAMRPELLQAAAVGHAVHGPDAAE